MQLMDFSGRLGLTRPMWHLVLAILSSGKAFDVMVGADQSMQGAAIVLADEGMTGKVKLICLFRYFINSFFGFSLIFRNTFFYFFFLFFHFKGISFYQLFIDKYSLL